jgi:hypothetical protein
VGLRFTVSVLAALAAIAMPATARAGTIGFKTDVEVTSGPGVDAKATITHTGDEAAEDVSVRAELLDKSATSATSSSIAPGQSQVFSFHLFDDIPKGVYAIVLRTRYADANGYQFEVVSTAVAPVGVKAAPRMFGNLDVPRVPVGGDVKARLMVKRPPERSGEFEADLVAPSGMDVKPRHVKLAFDAAGKATATLQVRNLKLLAGTTVNVFALVKGTDPGFPQVDAIRGSVSISPSVTHVTAPMFYQVAGAVFAILVLLEGIAWAMARPRANA